MAWNEVSAANSWQRLSVAVQIAEQYNRRVNAILTMLPVAEIPTEATSVYAFVKQMQAYVTAYYMRSMAIDPSAIVLGLTPSEPYPERYASIDEVYTVAGIASGFRRVPDNSEPPADWTDYADAAFVGNYGTVQDHDMIGPWLFEDLQKMLDAQSRYLFGVYATDDSCSASVVLYDEDPPSPDYPPGGPTYETGAGTVNAYAFVQHAAENTYYWGGYLSKFKLYAVITAMGVGPRNVDFIGTLGIQLSGTFFTNYGTGDTTTHIIDSLTDDTATPCVSKLFDPGITTWGEFFLTKPAVVGQYAVTSARFDRLVALVKFDA